MRTQTQQASYQEAVDVLINLGMPIQQACFRADVHGSNGVWSVHLLGYQSPQMAKLIRGAGVTHTGSDAFPASHTVHHRHTGYRGRVLLEVVAVETVVRRVEGRPPDRDDEGDDDEPFDIFVLE